MEKKNTILLTVIAVATLLVAVVGATFAYFTATSGTDNNASSTGAVETATVSTVKLTTADVGKSTRTVYPGTTNYAAISVVASKELPEGADAATDDTDYNITYTVNGSITLSEAFTAGSVTYSVYRTTEEVETPVTCTLSTDNAQYSDSCNLDALTSAAGSQQVVTDQTVSGTTATVSVPSQTLSTDGSTTYYYYLVVSYPNQESDQNADQDKTITAQLTGVKVDNTAEVA